jgi:putative MATE family efflux protein
VQAIVARQRGEGNAHLAGRVLNDAVALSALAGLGLAAVAFFGGPLLVEAVVRDHAAAAYGVAYLRTLSPALLFIGANYAFSAFWNGSGEPKRPLLVTVVQVPVNIALAALLTFGWLGLPRLGTQGVGLAALLAALLANGLHLVLLSRKAGLVDFLRRPPRLEGMAAILRIGLPISAQQTLLHVGTMIYFFIISLLGAQYIAIHNVIIGLDHLAILPAIGAGIAAASFVGHALGRRDVAEAQRWGFEVATVATLLTVPVAAVMMLFPHGALSLFIHDPATVERAVWPVRILGVCMCVDTFGRVLGFALRGAGATRSVAAVNFLMHWAVQLPAAWVIGVFMGYGLTGIACGRLVLLVIETLIIAGIWRAGAWSRAKVVTATAADADAAPAAQAA